MIDLTAAINCDEYARNASTSAQSAVLIDASADVLMGTPTFFLAGVGIAQLVVNTME